jgi:bacteriocin biosynthesis cyclodehydratase domain-containing protein
VPHLVVRLVDGGALLGPFVVPGETACLRCIDAHESVRDPDHVAVTTRYAQASGSPRGDGVPDLDPALASIALAWAVRDVTAHLDGHEPSTWSRTLHLRPDPTRREEQAWPRHPHCGCSWAADDPASGTMEA